MIDEIVKFRISEFIFLRRTIPGLKPRLGKILSKMPMGGPASGSDNSKKVSKFDLF